MHLQMVVVSIVMLVFFRGCRSHLYLEPQMMGPPCFHWSFGLVFAGVDDLQKIEVMSHICHPGDPNIILKPSRASIPGVGP